mmetsp:Transcript_15526/g.33486  ORF Transcript_15526/g.33486 Transcript_15526/m.33486 type:complete len:292 (+) Transcript_15526:501-1376(+)
MVHRLGGVHKSAEVPNKLNCVRNAESKACLVTLRLAEQHKACDRHKYNGKLRNRCGLQQTQSKSMVVVRVHENVIVKHNLGNEQLEKRPCVQHVHRCKHLPWHSLSNHKHACNRYANNAKTNPEQCNPCHQHRVFRSKKVQLFNRPQHSTFNVLDARFERFWILPKVKRALGWLNDVLEHVLDEKPPMRRGHLALKTRQMLRELFNKLSVLAIEVFQINLSTASFPLFKQLPNGLANLKQIRVGFVQHALGLREFRLKVSGVFERKKPNYGTLRLRRLLHATSDDIFSVKL